MCWFARLRLTKTQPAKQLRVVVGRWNATWRDLLIVFNGDGITTLSANRLPSGAGRSGPGLPQNADTRNQFAMTAVYRWASVRQGFDQFSLLIWLSEIIIKVIRTFSYYYSRLPAYNRSTSYQGNSEATDQTRHR